jgi:hypothetical protein
MRLWIGLLSASGVGVVVGLWWWLGRTPPDRGSHVSSAWLDEQTRGRRQ